MPISVSITHSIPSVMKHTASPSIFVLFTLFSAGNNYLLYALSNHLHLSFLFTNFLPSSFSTSITSSSTSLCTLVFPSLSHFLCTSFCFLPRLGSSHPLPGMSPGLLNAHLGHCCRSDNCGARGQHASAQLSQADKNHLTAASYEYGTGHFSLLLRAPHIHVLKV